MTSEERDRLVAVLMKKMCGPRAGEDGANAQHEGCLEAEALIAIVSRES